MLKNSENHTLISSAYKEDFSFPDVNISEGGVNVFDFFQNGEKCTFLFISSSKIPFSDFSINYDAT